MAPDPALPAGKPQQEVALCWKTHCNEVVLIDGDYAHLKRLDKEVEGLNPVARFLLPMEIDEGSRLLYHNLEYTIAE